MKHVPQGRKDYLQRRKVLRGVHEPGPRVVLCCVIKLKVESLSRHLLHLSKGRKSDWYILRNQNKGGRSHYLGFLVALIL